MSDLNIEHLRQWIGKAEESSDIVTPQAVRRLRATLFCEALDGPPPLLTQWTLAPQVAPFSGIGVDGHPAKGGFLPPVPLPRRMWAGGKVEFFDRLRAGDEVSRTSRIEDVTEKSGSTGTLCFVTVIHENTTARGLSTRERQDIVYRAPVAPSVSAASAKPDEKKVARPDAKPPQHSRTLPANEVTLFRYSAITFNGHRIHYDHAYATDEEGYAGLVVQGPFQASLLAEFAADVRGGRMPKTFEYRGVAPLFAGADFTLNANDTETGLDVWSANAAGRPCMKGSVTW